MFGKYRQPYRGPRGRVVERSGSEIVGIILALGIAGALNVITFALVWDVLSSPGALPPLSENTTQVLTGWGGGMLAVLGAYVGYTFGKAAAPGAPDVEEEPPPPRPPARTTTPAPRQTPPAPADRPKQMPPAPPGTQGPGSGPPPPGFT